MPESEVHILCTRPLNEAILQKAAVKNVYVETIPFIETMGTDDQAVIDEISMLAGEHITAVFTSMNAVEAAAKHVKGKVSWKIFCLGGITKELVQEKFGAVAIAGTAKNASALAQRIIDAGDVKDVVFFCGDQHLSFLPQMLTEATIGVRRIIVYTNLPINHVVEKNYDGILFFSPSAVHSFFQTNTIAQQVVLFAIGSTTAATIATYCTNKVITSEWPGKEQMIEKATAYFETLHV